MLVSKFVLGTMMWWLLTRSRLSTYFIFNALCTEHRFTVFPIPKKKVGKTPRSRQKWGGIWQVLDITSHTRQRGDSHVLGLFRLFHRLLLNFCFSWNPGPPHGPDNTKRQMQCAYPCCCSLVVASSAPMWTFISSGRMKDCTPANHEE